MRSTPVGIHQMALRMTNDNRDLVDLAGHAMWKLDHLMYKQPTSDGYENTQ